MAVRKYRQRGARVSPQKNETKAPKISDKKPVELNNKSKKAVVVAQEIRIARLLANNDKKVRDKVLKRLNKWLTVRSQSSFVFTKTDFMSLWKGLFYCMWMSDKMLVQEELAESVSKLVHCLKSKDTVILYTSCALQTLATEWFGIDQYRLDKFFMLVRRILRQTFVVCKNHSWNKEWLTEFSKIFTQLFLHVKTGIGFNLHITEIYLEELAKVGNGNLSEDIVHELVKPFAEYLITTNDDRQMKHIMQHIFRYLIFQSDIGLDYIEKFNAWKNAGFPCAHIDDMQKVEILDIEENTDNEGKQFSEAEPENEIEKPLDPRAGKVDVELPPIPFNAAKIAELLSTYKFHPSSTAKSRRQLLRLFDEFTELSQGKMPLGIKRVRKPNRQRKEMDSRKAALRLIKFEKDLVSDKMNKKRKREGSGKAVCDEVSIDDTKNGNTLDLETNAIKPENKLIDTTTTAKTELQDVDANAVPFKKRKRSDSTCDVSSTKSDITENKKKLQIDTNKKSKVTKKKLNKKDKKFIVDKNVEHKLKKTVISLERITKTNDSDQHTSISRISNKKVPLEKTSNKPVTKKGSEMKSKNPNQKIPLKNKSPHQIKKQTNLNNSTIEKKKVIFRISRNTTYHTSEYLQQVRKSPAIPFDANKKPLNSMLKMNPIPSPFNPFYYKK